MNDRYRSRLAMFKASLAVLNLPEYKPLWQRQPPLIFTTKVVATEGLVAALEAAAQAQSTDITGGAADKAQEERELEDVCILYGGTAAMWYRDHGDATNAAKIDLTPSGWRKLAEQELIGQSRVLRDLLQAIVDSGTGEADDWGLTAEAVASITKESDEFAAAITDPQTARAKRKAQTAALRPQFAAINDALSDLDSLILHFSGAPAGDSLIAAYQNARNIIDRGKGSSTAPEEPADESGP